MSGPVSRDDVEAEPVADASHPPRIDVIDSRATHVGEFPVRRALPRRARRTVGAWCFVDHMGPARVEGARSTGVAPHPHIGLQTVTWLLEGEVLHRDSLGSEQVIRPGQLNLMTAGHGVAHSEEGTGRAVELHGVQLWVALPSETRAGLPAFEHHAELPRLDLGGGEATVLVGTFGGVASPARRDTDHMGADLSFSAGVTTLPFEPAHEHALVVLDGAVELEGVALAPGQLGYVGPGRDESGLVAHEPSRVLLVGGVPFAEPVLMWWNYVARTRGEIVDAHSQWTRRTERFGHVASDMAPIDVAPPPWDRDA